MYALVVELTSSQLEKSLAFTSFNRAMRKTRIYVHTYVCVCVKHFLLERSREGAVSHLEKDT